MFMDVFAMVYSCKLTLIYVNLISPLFEMVKACRLTQPVVLPLPGSFSALVRGRDKAGSTG